jgi:hypothetical protein
MSVIDLARRRWHAAKTCDEVSATDALHEAKAEIEDGTLNAKSVIVILLCEDEDGETRVDMLHGGPASTNERIGMLVRAQFVMMGNRE